MERFSWRQTDYLTETLRRKKDELFNLWNFLRNPFQSLEKRLKKTSCSATAEMTARCRAQDGVEPYMIPAGGTNAVGALGFVNARDLSAEISKTDFHDLPPAFHPYFE